MKKLSLATLILSSCACYASVKAGSNNTYTVDNHGAPINATDPKERLPSKIKFMPESKAMQCERFKSNSPIALF